MDESNENNRTDVDLPTVTVGHSEMTVDDYVQMRLAKASISLLISHSGISTAALKEMRRAGFQNAGQVPDILGDLKMTDLERARIRHWYEARQQEYIADYHQGREISEEDFVRDRLENTSITNLLGDRRLRILSSTLTATAVYQELWKVGIRNASQIPDSLWIPEITDGERARIREWYEERKQEYKAEYRLMKNRNEKRFSPNAGWWQGLDSEALNRV